MCVAYFWLKAHSQLLLLIAFNRDEFLERPTNSLHLWDDESGIIGGRDAVNGGTWLGLTRSGRFAFVTNFREVHFDSVRDPLSRGALPTDFLKGSQTPAEYAAGLDLQNYNGFNLVVGDVGSVSAVHVSNRGTEHVEALQPGVHGVSNGEMQSRWPKVAKGEAALRELLEGADVSEGQLHWSDMFEALQDAQRPPDAEVPRSDMDWDTDLTCSSIFVPLVLRDGRRYGTRSQTVAAVWASGKIEVQERSLSADSSHWRHTSVVSSLLGECGGEEAR